MQIELVVIDPQEDFVNKNGSLSVKGADGDMDRLALFIKRMKGKLGDIHVTLDSHHVIDISHPEWFVDDHGHHPNPFTCMRVENGKIMGYTGPKLDVPVGEFRTTRLGSMKRTIEYLEKLSATGRYPHVIWPKHCLIGKPGHNVWPTINEALDEWLDQHKHKTPKVDFVTKGSNQWTEHFSAVKAEVPDPADPFSQVNSGLIQTLENADIILLSGEALSHCVANTMRDIASNFSDPKYVGKVHLLRDATSNVGGFDFLGDAFIKDLVAKGMQLTTTTQFLANV